ncbi:hypothetical protein BUALT_Bualt01G0051500 [Buddleja alternifolia]|uniref:Uncharacterized protein n=1 Tax=Buddleja alternifolia TaxID=168488 RepID=A0AAV6YF45_9LAMI|nr:hypothetical protein BUALT_Bualt01G0051500 [Buddleja alternifolia]
MQLVRTVIGDRGLIVLAQCCARIKRLRILLGTDDQVMEDEGGVSDTGLVALALGCRELEQLNVFVWDITNESLEYIGKCLKELRDFRLCLIKGEITISDLPLDFGVKSVLRGCEKLTRLDLELRLGWLTDVGLSFIGRNSQNIRRMLLSFVGETDRGLEMFSRWCRGFRHLEIRRCTFSENAVALAAIQLTSVTYLWVQFENSCIRDRALSHMVRPRWVMELIQERRRAVRNGNHVFVARQKPHLLAYYSVDGRRRTDAPGTITLM